MKSEKSRGYFQITNLLDVKIIELVEFGRF